MTTWSRGGFLYVEFSGALGRNSPPGLLCQADLTYVAVLQVHPRQDNECIKQTHVHVYVRSLGLYYTSIVYCSNTYIISILTGVYPAIACATNHHWAVTFIHVIHLHTHWTEHALPETPACNMYKHHSASTYIQCLHKYVHTFGEGRQVERAMGFL